MRLLNYCSNISIEMKSMKVENSKTNEVHDWKKMRQQFKIKKPNIIPSTWNDDFEVPEGFVQCHIFYIISSTS